MTSLLSQRPLRTAASLAAVLGAFALCTQSALADSKKKNPTSKVYVADVNGEAQIDTGEQIEDLNKKSVYNAQGTVIETKPNANNAMVFSNGTGAYYDPDTRVEMKRFTQEPFTPNRSDLETEPSISQTQAFVSRGTVGLCTSKLVAGSTMNYQTPLGNVNIRGRKVVIEVKDSETKISMIEGDSTIRTGNLDLGGTTLHAGEQAIIRPGPPGQPNVIEVGKIPSNESSALDDKVAMACMAKKTVYFEVRERKNENDSQNPDAVTAFDGSNSSGNNDTSPEIVPVEIVPGDLPTQYTVSPANLTTPGE